MLCARTGIGHVVRDPLAAVERAVREHPELSMLVGPEWFFLPERGLASGEDFRNLRERLRQLSRGSSTLLAPGSIAWRGPHGRCENTALVVSDGEVLKTYSKRGSGGDARVAALGGTTFEPGRSDGVFSWTKDGRSYRVGIELCIDHGARRLFDETLGERGSHVPVDIQLLSACDYGRIDGGLAIGPGGLFVFNDGHQGQKPLPVDVRGFAAEKRVGGGSFTGPDRYWGWKSGQIAWKTGRASAPQPLTDDVSLMIFSIAPPAARASFGARPGGGETVP